MHDRSERPPYLLIGLLAVLTFAIGGIAWKFYAHQKAAFRNEVNTRLLAIADNKVRQINEWREVRLGEARAMMQNAIVAGAFQRIVERRATAEERSRAAETLASWCRNRKYAGAYLVDRSGGVLAEAGRRFGNDAHLRDVMRLLLEKGDVVERDLHNFESGGAPHLGMNMPLRPPGGGPIFGGLLLSLDPRDYLYPLQSWPLPTKTGEILLIRRESDSVLYVSDLRRQAAAAMRHTVPLSRRELVEVMAVNGSQGAVRGLDYSGLPVFAAIQKVPNTNWYLIAKEDEEEALGPLREGATLMGVTALSLILATGALVFFLWRRHQVRVYGELYETAAARREIAEQYGYLSRFANDAILLLDADGMIVRANDRAADLYGYSTESLIGMNFRDLCSPEASEGFDADWKLAGERASLVYESIHRTRAGRDFPVETSMRSVEVKGLLYRQAIIRDISERKAAELELSQSESRLRQVVNNSPYGIVVLDELTIVYANPEMQRMFGAKNAAELLGRLLLDFVSEAERENVLANSARFARGEAIPVVERVYHRLDGSEFWASITCGGIEFNGRPARLLFFRDITKSKLDAEHRAVLEEQLRHAQKMESVGRLAGGIAHDFNNYLTVINGYCDMLLARAPENGDLREPLKEIRDAGARAVSVTRQLLAFSRKQLVAPRALSLSQTVTDAGGMLRRLTTERIEIVTDLQTDLVDVMADPGQMDQVLMNLVINAADAMPAGGRVTIETRTGILDEAGALRHRLARPGAYAVLSVSDTGTGIAPELQEKIFEPFFTTKGAGHGTGLGLATTYGIVTQAGGWIEVESIPGHGATFRVWLPATTEARTAAAAAQKKGDATGRGATLLVVEDQAEVRRLTLSILKERGYRLLEADSAEAALELSRRWREPIDLLLTDVVMPGKSGRELAEELAGERPEMQVLYMSGYSGDATGEAILDPEMECIAKPFTPDQLAAKVGEVLARRNARTVLVIDDDPAVCGLLRQILTEAGYRVLVALDGRRGMNLFRRESVDVVITDLVMPEQEGLETVSRLRRERPNLPVIAISGAFGGTFLKVAGRFGASATLPKPIARETLLETVGRFAG